MGKKRQNLNHARNMDVDAWRSRQISKRLKARLTSQTEEFIERHGSDTDEQLREYVRRKAMLLHRMPHPLELKGGVYLSSRLGDWDRLAREFGVLPASRERGRRAYKRLREREAELFAEERRQKKEKKHQLRIEQAAKEASIRPASNK